MKASFPVACAVLLALASGVSAQSPGIDGILAPVTSTAPAAAAHRAAAPVRAAGMRLGEAEVFERVARKLTERLALEDGDLVISPAAAWTPVDVPAGTWDLTLIEAPDLKGLSASFFVRFRVDSGDRLVGEWQVAVRAEYFRDVWVAARRLTRGETPAPADLDKRRLNVLAERQAPVAARVAMDGFEVAQAVAAGQPLTDRDLVPRTLVRRGQVVNVVAADGPFSISMKAMATQDGAGGATIKVRNLTSQRDINAQVVGEGKVQVSF